MSANFRQNRIILFAKYQAIITKAFNESDKTYGCDRLSSVLNYSVILKGGITEGENIIFLGIPVQCNLNKDAVVLNLSIHFSGGISSAIGAYLCSEGLYYSNVHTGERQKAQGMLTTGRSGPKEKNHDSLIGENKKLRRKLEQAEKHLKKTEMIVEVQKNSRRLWRWKRVKAIRYTLINKI